MLNLARSLNTVSALPAVKLEMLIGHVLPAIVLFQKETQEFITVYYSVFAVSYRFQ